MVSASGLLPVMVLLPFIGALVPGLMIRAGRNACATFTAIPTLLALILLGVMAPDVMNGGTVTAQIDWLPGLGLNANFMLDGLGLLGYRSVLDRDYPVVFANLYIFSLIGLVVSLISDLTYTWIDPRIDFEKREG